MKFIKIIAVLAIGAIVGRVFGQWIHELTFQAWLSSGSRDRSGATIGGALAGLVQAAPMLYAVVLSKRIYSGNGNAQSTTTLQSNSTLNENKPSARTEVSSVYQYQTNEPQSQVPSGTNTKATNVEVNNAIKDFPSAVTARHFGIDDLSPSGDTSVQPDALKLNLAGNASEIAAKPARVSDPTARSKNSEDANEVFPERPAIEEKKISKALKVIEYSAAAAHSWAEVTAMPKIYQTRFLEALEAEPTIDTGKLAWQLIEEHQKQLRPYDNEDANDALAQARTIGEEAEKEFIEVYDLIGRLDDANFILQKIEAKFGPSQRTLDAQNQQERERQERERQERERQELEQQKREQHERERQERKIEIAALFERRQREREQKELDQIEKQRIRREQDRLYLQKLRREQRSRVLDKMGHAILIGLLVLIAVAIYAAVISN
ncbi:hypothetical protein MWN63_02775 [Paradonghicola geojensis]|nr:hypothetical protein [Marivivens geojensis]